MYGCGWWLVGYVTGPSMIRKHSPIFLEILVIPRTIEPNSIFTNILRLSYYLRFLLIYRSCLNLFILHTYLNNS